MEAMMNKAGLSIKKSTVFPDAKNSQLASQGPI